MPSDPVHPNQPADPGQNPANPAPDPPPEPTVCCGLCGRAMPEGEEMFQYHGYSGPCPTEDSAPDPIPTVLPPEDMNDGSR